MIRVHRLFQIHDSLSRGEPPRDAQEWADRFGVNVRTILRDMAFLKKELKVPLFFDPSVRGYRYEQTKLADMSDEKTSKWTRLLTLIHRIYAEPGLTAKELAEITGRTERTIFRDVRELEDAGFPIYNDSGYRFAADAFLPNLNLSPT
jgi:predicted DNA-binding transcriptional regulator YafY